MAARYKKNQEEPKEPVYLTNKLLWRLAKQVNRDYRDLGISLGMAGCTIDEIEADYRSSVATITLKVLEKWIYSDKRQDAYEMYKDLLDALSNIERNDLIEFVTVEAKHPSARHQQGQKDELSEKERRLEEEMTSLEQQYDEKLLCLEKQLEKSKEERLLEEEAKLCIKKTKEVLQHENEDLHRVIKRLKQAKQEEIALLDEQLNKAVEEAKACEERSKDRIRLLKKQKDELQKEMEVLEKQMHDHLKAPITGVIGVSLQQPHT